MDVARDRVARTMPQIEESELLSVSVVGVRVPDGSAGCAWVRPRPEVPGGLLRRCVRAGHGDVELGWRREPPRPEAVAPRWALRRDGGREALCDFRGPAQQWGQGEGRVADRYAGHLMHS